MSIKRREKSNMKKLSKTLTKIIEITIQSVITASLLLTALQLGGQIHWPFWIVSWSLIVIGIAFVIVTLICIGGIIYERCKKR